MMLNGEEMEVIYNEQFGVMHLMSSELDLPLRKRDSSKDLNKQGKEDNGLKKYILISHNIYKK